MAEPIILENFPENMIFNIDAFPLSGKSVFVPARNSFLLYVFDAVKSMHNELLHDIQRHVYATVLDINIDKVFDDIDKGLMQAVKQWDDFCNLLVIGYTVRFVLHRMCIPLSYYED